jgi:DNA repair exonuclease SbcCD ATPase subunit
MRDSGLNKRATELRERLGARRRNRARTAPAGGSGLARASQIRARLGVGDSASEGISADDRRDIAHEIDSISRRNRLSARPEDFIVRPARKGFAFPLAVNLLALAATVGAVFLLSRIFRQRDLELATTASSLETAEGKLLRELKRESESRLLEKDRAIADFQVKIAQIDRERDKLAAGIDDRVKAREAELRVLLKGEIEAERERLASERLSAAARDAKLKTYENERTAALDRALAEDRAKAEAEKASADEKYRQLKEDYQKSIASLGEERRRLQDESKKREADIRAQAEASARELEARGAAAMAGLEKARAELSSLEQQKARREAVEERVLGLYDGIRAALRERRFEAAATASEALASYLNDPETAAETSLKARRDADLFVAQTLGTYARGELARAAVDTGKLLEQASVLAAAREAAQAAGSALKAGDAELARVKYGEALAMVPEILAAHQYFLDRASAEEAARRAKLDEYLAAAESAYRSGDRALMIARYTNAIEYLPVPESARNDMIARLGQPAPASDAAAASASSAARKSADTIAARGIAAKAERRLAAKDWPGAISDYVQLISTYPAAEQVADALSGIDTARSRMQKASESAEAAAKAALMAEADRADAARGEAQAAQAALAAAKGELEAARSDLAASKQAEAGLRNDIEALKKRLADEQRKTAAAAAAVEPASSTASQAAQAGRIEELQAEVARLKAVADRHEGLVASYQSYRTSEAAAEAKGGAEALIDASAKLDAFLGSDEAKGALPGLRESVARYEQAYQRAGQREVLYNALDVLDGAVGAKDAAARERYFRDLEGRYAGDQAMLDFIAGLRRNLK